jgi:hemoglobin-like flavoprotein
MDRQAAMAQSLERVAERHGDPAAFIYARLFAARPELERLFLMDRSGAVRGNMLAVAFDALLDVAGPNDWGLNLILAERTNHDGLNVPPTEFLFFLGVMRDCVRDLAGADWTPDAEAAWAGVLTEIAAACSENPAP